MALQSFIQIISMCFILKNKAEYFRHFKIFSFPMFPGRKKTVFESKVCPFPSIFLALNDN